MTNTVELTLDEVYEALRDVYDPEIPVNIVDLGLVRDVSLVEGNIDMKMTLTFAGCGMGTLHRATGGVAACRTRGRRGHQRRPRLRPALDPRRDHRRRQEAARTRLAKSISSFSRSALLCPFPLDGGRLEPVL